MTTQVLRDNQGNIHIGPGGGAPSGAKIDVDFHSTDVDGIALAALASPAIGSERAAIKLGDYVLGQDTAKTGSKNLGVLNAAGALALPLMNAGGKSLLPVNLYKSCLPLIIAPTGSMGDNSALTSGTVNPLTYLKTFTWFPASALYSTGTTPASAANSPAGWYYTVWTTTTAATVYANTWDGASEPMIPTTLTALPVAVSGGIHKGPGAFTGPTTNAAYMAFPMAAASVDTKYEVVLKTTETNNGNAKTVTARVTDVAGTLLWTDTLTSLLETDSTHCIDCQGVADVQLIYGKTFGSTAFVRQAAALAAVATSAAWVLAICASKATATDVTVIECIRIQRTN